MIQWHEKPPTYGWYFFTAKAEDYDVARPVPVNRYENYTGIWYEALLPGTDKYVDIADVVGMWYGPIRLPPI